MTLSELKCHFCCLESYSSMNTARINLITLCVYMNGKLSVVCNRNCFPKLKDFSRLGPPRGSRVHRKSGGVKEMVQNRHIVTTYH